ncbi:MAG TPA: hypothetical protein PK683_07490 [Leptospiraceae bacterium]|nr:hypothetical protein [Leptospiraceae bacterium]
MKTLIAFFLIMVNLHSTDEKTEYPFFEFQNQSTVILKNAKIQICLVESENLLNREKETVEVCLPAAENLDSVWQYLRKAKITKKTTVWRFYEESVKTNPMLVNSQTEYFLQSIILKKKDRKKIHLELLNDRGGYYYIAANPDKIIFEKEEK